MPDHSPRRSTSASVCGKARSSDRCYSCCIPPILRHWSTTIASILICTWITRKCIWLVPTEWPTYVNMLQARMSQCIDDVWSWTRSNRLQVNPAKTEFVWCAPSRRRHHIPTSDVVVCNDPIHPVQSVRDLGVYVDGAMTMRTHINHVLSSCFSALRQIKSIKRSLPAHTLTTLVTALIHSRLDYCNVVFAGLPNCDILRMQSVLNTAIRLVAGASRWNHATCLLRDHHWLPVKQRIDYKLCMTVHRCLNSEAPRYLADLITLSAAATTRAGLRSATSGSVAVLRTTLSLGDRLFAVAAPRAWKKLPSPLHRIESVNTFKRQLKTFLYPGFLAF